MSNLIDYVTWRGDLSTASVPLSAPDFGVFALAAYAPLETLPADSRCGNTIGQLADLLPLEPTDAPVAPNWKDDHLKLWTALRQAPRFSGWRLDRFACVFDDNVVDELDVQFSACTFSVDDVAVVCFRGTDSTVVGWREDFTMSYEDQVPAQVEAVAYLDATLDAYRAVYVCGHSKGGNLALYSAVSCKEPGKIAAVYNFDGPGLIDALLATDAWALLKDRTFNYVPESSVIGRIYNRNVERLVVDADGVSILQHNMYLWHVEGPRFVPAPELTPSSQIVARSLEEFVDTTAKEERKDAVYGMFKVIKATDVRTVDELVRAVTTKLPTLVKTVDLTEGEVAGIKRLAAIFVKNAGEQAKGAATAAVGNIGDSISDGLSAAVESAKQSAFVGNLTARLSQLGESLEQRLGKSEAEAPAAENAATQAQE